MKRKKSFKNNKVLLVLIGILLICFIVLGFGFYKYFYAGTGQSKYGDRLNGIEEYPLSESLEDEVKTLYSKENTIGEVSVDVKGRIIYITIDFKEIIKVEDAKKLALKSLDVIGEKNLTFYEIQYVLTASYEKDAEKKSFPIFGSKGINSSKVVW